MPSRGRSLCGRMADRDAEDEEGILTSASSMVLRTACHAYNVQGMHRHADAPYARSTLNHHGPLPSTACTLREDKMCGRISQASGPIRLAIVDGLNVVDSRYANMPPRYNGAPSQDILVIWQNHETGERSLDPLKWGLIPYWCKDPKGGRKPINAKAETVAALPTFRDAYRKRRCIVPVDGFYEWKAIKGQKTKQPYAIAMKDGTPFGIAGLWENWKDPATGEWIRTFAVVTTDANEMVADIHNRMPAILAPSDYARWLSDDPDPHDLLRPFPADLMRMWPISTRVNKPENDDAAIIEPVELTGDAA
jgi:putative SOS response-associated peptidase YedK